MRRIESSVSGLILAGGEGRRMGGRDKGLAPWRGKPLVEHVVERFAPQVGGLLISCNRNLQAYAAFADQVVEDQAPGHRGPLAGIQAAIPFCATEYLAVVPCDMPVLPRQLVARLLAGLNSGGHAPRDAAFAVVGDTRHHLCLLLRRSSLETLDAYLNTGQRSVHGWLGELASQAVDFSACREGFLNVNHAGTAGEA